MPGAEYPIEFISRKSPAKSGVEMEIIQEGDGMTFPHIGKNIIYHEVSCLEDGTELNNTRKRNRPYNRKIRSNHMCMGMCKGLSESLMKMSKGARAKLLIPPDEMGFGAKRVRGIPPNSTILCDVQLLDIC